MRRPEVEADGDAQGRGRGRGGRGRRGRAASAPVTPGASTVSAAPSPDGSPDTGVRTRSRSPKGKETKKGKGTAGDGQTVPKAKKEPNKPTLAMLRQLAQREMGNARKTLGLMDAQIETIRKQVTTTDEGPKGAELEGLLKKLDDRLSEKVRGVYMCDDVQDSDPGAEATKKERDDFLERLKKGKAYLELLTPVVKCSQATLSKDPDNYCVDVFKQKLNACFLEGVKVSWAYVAAYQKRLCSVTMQDAMAAALRVNEKIGLSIRLGQAEDSEQIGAVDCKQYLAQFTNAASAAQYKSLQGYIGSDVDVTKQLPEVVSESGWRGEAGG